MFTGLVEDVGTVVRADRRSDALMLAIRPDHVPATQMIDRRVGLPRRRLPDRHRGRRGRLPGPGRGRDPGPDHARPAPGRRRVNLERALRAGDRLGGHLVAGHVDGVGEITARRDEGANVDLHRARARRVLRYVVEKGSIAVDGISLTINRVDPPGGDGTFDVAIIPHTAQATTLADKHVGRRVNLEVDVIGKYVERMLGGYQKAPS